MWCLYLFQRNVIRGFSFLGKIFRLPNNHFIQMKRKKPIILS